MTVHTAPIPVVLPASAPQRMASGIVLGVASALTFAISGPLVKPLLNAGWSVGAALMLRIGLSALVLSPVLIRAVRADPGLLRRHARAFVVFGMVPVVGCQLLYFSAMQRMPVAVALLIQYLAPVFIVLFVWARTRIAPSRLVVSGAIVAVTGLVLVVDIAGARFDLLGTLFALAAALCACVYFLMSERTGSGLPPLVLASGGLVAGALAMLVLSVTGLLPFAAPMVDVPMGPLTVPAWVPILIVGAVGTSCGYALGVTAVPRMGARLASFVGLSEVLFALAFAWLLLGETPAPVQFLGGALLLAGVIAVRMDAEKPVSSSSPAPAGAAPGTR